MGRVGLSTTKAVENGDLRSLGRRAGAERGEKWLTRRSCSGSPLRHNPQRGIQGQGHGKSVPLDGVHFRTCHGRVVPYVKVKIDLALVKEIRLGPRCPIDESDPGLELLLRKAFPKGHQPPVVRSDFPVRK